MIDKLLNFFKKSDPVVEPKKEEVVIMSDKYPRTLHLPFSPGKNSDDKILESSDHFLERDIVILEKADGANACLTPTGIFSRTHAHTPSHPSFDHLKALWATIKHDIPEGWSIFGENMVARHSIFYDGLPAHFLVFGIRMDLDGDWLSWSDVKTIAKSLNLTTIPELWRGEVGTEKELKEVIKTLVLGGSRCGGESMEGIVVRDAQHFFAFDKCVAKYVRKNHIQTSDNWSNGPFIVNKLKE